MAIIRFNQVEYTYITQWLNNLQYSKTVNAEPNQYLGLENATRILTSILEQPVDFESLDSDFERSTIADDEIELLAQRYKATLEFNRITPSHLCSIFVKNLQDIAKDRAKPLVHSMIIYQLISEEEEGEYRKLFLIDQLTGQTWLACDSSDYGSFRWQTNYRQVLPALCHAANAKLRDNELEISEDVPKVILDCAISHHPKRKIINHSEMECNCELVCDGDCLDSCVCHSLETCSCECSCKCVYQDTWTPIMLIRNMNIIPFVNVEEAHFNPTEILYLSALPGLAQWANWKPESLLDALDNGDLDIYDLERQGYSSNYCILLTSGLAATVVARNGLPNLRDSETLFSARIFSQSHTLLLIKLASSFITISSNYSYGNRHEFSTRLVENVTDFEDIRETIPAFDLQQDLLGLLLASTDIQLIETNENKDSFHVATQVYTDIDVQSFLFRATVNGKRTMWRCPEKAEISHKFFTSLTEEIKKMDALAIACCLYGLDNNGFNLKGKFCFGDPFVFGYEHNFTGHVALVPSNQYLRIAPYDNAFTLNIDKVLKEYFSSNGITIPTLNRSPLKIIETHILCKTSLMSLRLELTKTIEEAAIKLETNKHLVSQLRNHLIEHIQKLDRRSINHELRSHLVVNKSVSFWVSPDCDMLPFGVRELMELSRVLAYEEKKNVDLESIICKLSSNC